MQMLGGRQEGGEQQQREVAQPSREQLRDRQAAVANRKPEPTFSDMDNDIPF
jgi:single-stranded DNA-binding protein